MDVSRHQFRDTYDPTQHGRPDFLLKFTVPPPAAAESSAEPFGESETIAKQQRLETLELASDFDYAAVPSLSNEVREKLQQCRPATVGSAARIPGVTPAAISLLLVHLKRVS